jgi:Tfp pilus assembly protein PilX
MIMCLGKQTGAVLAISLLLLTVLTLAGVVAINTSITNLRLAGNMQIQQETEAAAQLALESYLSSATPFTASTCDPISENKEINKLSVVIDVNEPVCLRSKEAQGYSALWELAPEETEWEIRVTGSNSAMGSQVILRQGVSILLSSGNCALAPSQAKCSP